MDRIINPRSFKIFHGIAVSTKNHSPGVKAIEVLSGHGIPHPVGLRLKLASRIGIVQGYPVADIEPVGQMGGDGVFRAVFPGSLIDSIDHVAILEGNQVLFAEFILQRRFKDMTQIQILTGVGSNIGLLTGRCV